MKYSQKQTLNIIQIVRDDAKMILLKKIKK